MNPIICGKVKAVNEDGIVLQSKKELISISFADCASNYAIETSSQISTCVAIRDITRLSFTFFSQPKTIVAFKKSIFMYVLTGKSAVSRFIELQNAIIEAGYTSYDMS